MLLLIPRDAAFLRIVCGLRRLQVIDVVNIAERLLLLHLYRVDYGLGNDSLLLMSLGFHIQTFGL